MQMTHIDFYEGWNPVDRFNQPSWVAVDTQTDRPKSARNRCVIEIVGGVLCCHFAFWNVLLV